MFEDSVIESISIVQVGLGRVNSGKIALKSIALLHITIIFDSKNAALFFLKKCMFPFSSK